MKNVYVLFSDGTWYYINPKDDLENWLHQHRWKENVGFKTAIVIYSGRDVYYNLEDK